MTQESEVLAAMNAHVAARLDGDVDAVLDSLSDKWEDSKGTKKISLQEGHVAFSASVGANVRFDLGNAKISIEEEFATCGPVVIDTEKGRITYKYKLKKEADTVWRLIYTQTIDWEPFPMDEATQAMKDEIDSTAMIVRAHRERLLKDPFRPGYHFTVPEGVAVPFDPNGAIFWQGRYHLFYIFQDKRLGRKSDHWGHVSSTDLFHWRHHPTGLLEGMYSGNCFLNEDGVPTMCYHQVDQGNAMAVALDNDLDDWRKLDSNPITPETKEDDEHHGKYRSWDPFGWYDGKTYYAIFGGEHPAIAKTTSLSKPWSYVGDLFAHGLDGVSLEEDVSCADLFKLGDKDVLLCISHRMGCRYYIGEWKNEQFYPETHGQMSWVDNTFFAPESIMDEKGRRIMWSWLLDFREFGVRLEQGWSGTMSLPRVLWLNENNEMRMDVPKEIESLRYKPNQLQDIEVQPNTEANLKTIKGNSIEISLKFEQSTAEEYGIKVCCSPDGEEQTVISYCPTEAALKVDTCSSGPNESPKHIESAPLELPEGEQLRLRVFVDKSVVEVFANNQQAIMRRIYPARTDSVGVKLFAKGGSIKVNQLDCWQISPSNPY